MTDENNTQQTRVDQHGRNGQGAEVEPHRVHLLAAERELLGECHWHGVYLAICGAVLAVSDLESSWCEETCERMVIYCPDCVRDATKHNVEVGLVGSGPGTGLLLDERGQSGGESREAAHR